ncbi:MAG: LPP20 family lipoprotein [Proteobacteria bacterium]|nr:LPP20 family lipoprotein [Pseudomonadota bacterium]
MRFFVMSGIMNRFAFAFAMLLSIGLTGCASMSSQPTWISGEHPTEFPKKNFVSALGTGASLEAAQIAAKSELSRVFSAELKSEIELIDRESVVNERATGSSDVLASTIISTQIELQGAEVPLHWRDARTGEVWALAVLDRSRECLRIRSDGSDLITRLDALAEDSREKESPLLAIRAAIHAVEVGRELDLLQARSRVLGTQCLTSRSNSTGELKARVDRDLRRISFVVTARDIDPGTGKSIGPLPQLRERIAGNLTGMGFQVGPATGAHVIAVKARLRLRRVDRGTEWIEYRWEGSAEIGASRSGAPAIIAAESDGAESHPESSTARLRARRKGEQDLARQLDKLLKAFLAEG